MKSKKMRVAVLLGALTSGACTADSDVAEQKNAVTLQAGSYRLAKRNQDLQVVGDRVCVLFCLFSGHALNSLANEFDTSSRDVAGLEYERQARRGFSYGADVFHIRNSFVVPALNPSQGEMRANFFLATLKKYFGDPRGLRPFVGGGIGIVDANLGGSVNRSASGRAAQAVAGVRYQSGRISVVAEYRYVRAPSIELDAGNETGDVRGKLDLSGQGYFLGLGIHF
jgi:hypothetical protein